MQRPGLLFIWCNQVECFSSSALSSNKSSLKDLSLIFLARQLLRLSCSAAKWNVVPFASWVSWSLLRSEFALDSDTANALHDLWRMRKSGHGHNNNKPELFSWLIQTGAGKNLRSLRWQFLQLASLCVSMTVGRRLWKSILMLCAHWNRKATRRRRVNNGHSKTSEVKEFASSTSSEWSFLVINFNSICSWLTTLLR